MAIGVRVASLNIRSLVVTTICGDRLDDLKIGTAYGCGKGMYLGSSTDFCHYSVDGVDERLLTLNFEYCHADLMTGAPDFGSGVKVLRAKLTSVIFEDKADQEAFGSMFSCLDESVVDQAP